MLLLLLRKLDDSTYHLNGKSKMMAIWRSITNGIYLIVFIFFKFWIQRSDGSMFEPCNGILWIWFEFVRFRNSQSPRVQNTHLFGLIFFGYKFHILFFFFRHKIFRYLMEKCRKGNILAYLTYYFLSVYFILCSCCCGNLSAIFDRSKWFARRHNKMDK